MSAASWGCKTVSEEERIESAERRGMKESVASIVEAVMSSALSGGIAGRAGSNVYVDKESSFLDEARIAEIGGFKFFEKMRNLGPSVEREIRTQVSLDVGHGLKEKDRGRPEREFEGKDVLHDRMILDLLG